MEAHVAFSYVFKEDVEQKHVGIRSLAQETQVRLCNVTEILRIHWRTKLDNYPVSVFL